MADASEARKLKKITVTYEDTTRGGTPVIKTKDFQGYVKYNMDKEIETWRYDTGFVITNRTNLAVVGDGTPIATDEQMQLNSD